MNSLLGFITLAMILFSIGVIGIFANRNIFATFMSIILALNAVNLLFVAFAKDHLNMDGQVIALVLMSFVAIQSIIFLLVCARLFKNKEKLDIDKFCDIKDGE